MENNTKSETETEQHEKKITTTKKLIWLTSCLYMAFATMGLINSLTGPSLLHLSYLYNTDISGIAMTFTYNSIGYLISATLCAVIFDRYNHEKQLFVVTLIMGLFIVIATWMPHLYGYFACMTVSCLGAAFLNAGGQSYIIRLWHGHKNKNQAVQGIHAIWAVGAFICPLIVAHFLVDLPDDPLATALIHDNNTIANTQFLYNMTDTDHDTNRINSSYDNNSFNIKNSTKQIEGLNRLRYPYVIIGSIGVTLSFLFLATFCATKKKSHVESLKEKRNTVHSLYGDNKSFQIPILTIQVLFYFFYQWYENIPGGLLSAFVIKGLEWPIPLGPQITSLYWGSNGVGRIVGIPLSALVSPTTMVVTNVSLTTVAFTLMCIAPGRSDILMWISASMAGFVMSTTFPSVILWTSNRMTITGAVGATYLIASSVGAMSGAPLAAFLFERFSHMWVVYISLLSCLVHIVLLSAMLTFTKIYEKRISMDKKTIKDSEDDHKTMSELEHLGSDEIL